MRPRPDERGKYRRRSIGRESHLTSMRPRPDERGKEVRVNHLTVLVYR